MRVMDTVRSPTDTAKRRHGQIRGVWSPPGRISIKAMAGSGPVQGQAD